MSAGNTNTNELELELETNPDLIFIFPLLIDTSLELIQVFYQTGNQSVHWLYFFLILSKLAFPSNPNHVG
jgi:hypothetical protein